MDPLSNRFSALKLDVAGSSSSASASPTSNSENVRKKGEGEMQNKQERVTPPLVWIDLEMTGLDVEADRILEIACIITDGEVTKSIEGPDLVIHQSKERLDRMKKWCKETHGASGLTERAIRSRVTERDAELQVDLLELVMEFVKRHVSTGTNKPQIAGNSVYTDLIFLRKHMPELASIFSHVTVDVSSLKSLCYRWYPEDYGKAPVNLSKHRALADIKHSIKELQYYKMAIFKRMSN